MIGNEAHRVDALARWAGGHYNPFASQWPISRRGPCCHYLACALEDGLRRWQAPLSYESTGQFAVLGFHDCHTTACQRIQIFPHGRVYIHVVIHSRAHHGWAARRQRHGGQHRIAGAAHELRQGLRRERRHQEEIRPQAECNVLRPRPGFILGENLRVDLVLGQGTQCQGRHESGSVGRHDDAHLGARLLEEAHQFSGLVGRNATRHTQQDAPSSHRKGSRVSHWSTR